MTTWRGSSSAFLRRAWLPQRMNTTGWSLALTARMTSSVNVSQPLPWCDAAAPARTVNVVLSSSTPWRAHGSRLPWFGGGMPRSSLQLLVDVDQRRRQGDAVAHREAQPVGLPRAVVRVLAEDDDAGVGVRREVQGGEHLVRRRVDAVVLAFGAHERLQLRPVRLGELGPQHRVPVGLCRHADLVYATGRAASRCWPGSASMRVTASPSDLAAVPRTALATLPTPLERGPELPGRRPAVGQARRPHRSRRRRQQGAQVGVPVCRGGRRWRPVARDRRRRRSRTTAG